MPEQHRFKIRIRIVERREQIDIHCRNGFRLSSSTAVHKLPGIDRLQCQLRECLPATGDYWFKYALAPDPETVEQLAEQLNAAGVSTRIIEFGNTSGLIPGREPLHLLLAWPFNDPEQRHNVWREYRRLLPEQLPGDFSSPDDYLFIATTPAASSWRLQAGELQLSRSEPLRIEPLHTDDQVQVAGVRIGIDFHWDHTEELSYGGAVEVFVNHEGTLSLLNEIDLEEYLASVNSSEMTADCPLELLKAQTVAARSTLLATQGRHHWGEPFDLCSDDHCQCYQGTTRQQKSSVLAVQQTQGQVIAAADTVVDARYSKSCGGIVEAYRHVWEQRDP
ncbi:MAG: SpoIID/LytB domain-containing protein, partial [Candidatus Delongbacteria bacterium]|nr:SpoIID/LytB domain-containing protein [Candidatus Delongbacteria bacterium]